ncbi:MAG: cobalt ECF transporter T component CbiQ [Candidatus Adiutrix sp.]|jgi:cobalt/nickel transport system permease protein|nr:cobalt ECF transporter T component CbiQ [Candidatus Adiutrix sp.]
MTCRHLTSQTWLDRLDPRLKILAAVIWSFLLATLATSLAAALGLAGSLALAALARLAPGETLRRLAAVNVFILLMWLTLPFAYNSPGTVVASLGFLEVTREGLRLTILLTLKANGVALGAMAWLGAASWPQLAAAARKLGAPEKLTAMFVLMTRYFQVIRQEYARLTLAMRARGFQPGMNFHTYRSLANLVGLLLVRSVDRAERVHAAMLCRGYRGRLWLEEDFQLTRLDWVATGLLLAVVGGVLGCDLAIV